MGFAAGLADAVLGAGAAGLAATGAVGFLYSNFGKSGVAFAADAVGVFVVGAFATGAAGFAVGCGAAGLGFCGAGLAGLAPTR